VACPSDGPELGSPLPRGGRLRSRIPATRTHAVTTQRPSGRPACPPQRTLVLKFRIIQAGRPDRLVEVPGDDAVLGRTEGCEVLVPEPYVSRRHARIMAGVVVVDIGSRNGLFVEGERVDVAALIPATGFVLGTKEEDVRIEVEHLDLEHARLVPLREELDLERRRNAQLAAELARLERSRGGPPSDPEASPLMRQLRSERDDLARRVEALKREVESREVQGSEGLQARLAAESLEAVRRRNEELERQLARFESTAAAPALEAVKAALAARVAELEGDRAELEEESKRLKAELVAARAAAQPLPASELFFRLQAENSTLRKEVEELKSKRPSAASVGSSELFVELQRENRELKQRLEQAARAPAAPVSTGVPAGSSERVEELTRANHELRMSKADLLAELDQLRSKVAARPQHSVTSSVPAVTPSSSTAGAVPAALRAVVREDVAGIAPQLDGPADAFFALELFRFLRQAELVITRTASGFMQILEPRTILPDTSGSARALVEFVLDHPDERGPRENFLEYLAELQKWLVVTLGAHRRGAERFAEELRSEISERGLTADNPIPAYKRLAGMSDAELWQRAKEHLKRLTADVVDERIEALSRECAEEILREQGRG
jgi:pSer/pThr/pTyr-binding forkhead associated (FHA) protein